MKCVLIPQFSYRKFKNYIRKYQPNFLVGVPTLFESMLTSRFKENELACITNIISGGDTMSPDLKRRIDAFLKKYGSDAKVRVGYGLTECTAANCLTMPNELRDGCIGIPFPDMECKVVKTGTHIEAKPNEDGELCFSGPTVMLGYVNETKETMQTLRVHDDKKIWLHTGDIGYKDPEGMVFFQQRLKRMIISSGYNIYPSYIESVIDKHPAVNFSTVIGIDHPYKVQVAKAFIVLNEGYKPNSETLNSIKEHCAKNIAKYSLPYEYEFRESIPKTKIGKIAFNELMKEEQEKKKTNE
jgi:long-chain acyl-CoA synthetase